MDLSECILLGTELGSFHQNSASLIRINPNEGILEPHAKVPIKLTLGASQIVKRCQSLSLFVQFSQVKNVNKNQSELSGQGPQSFRKRKKVLYNLYSILL